MSRPGDPSARSAAASIRRAGHLLAGRELSAERLDQLAAMVHAWCDEVAESPERDKRAFLQQAGGMAEFMRTGVVQPPPFDGAEVVFDETSFIGGPSSGMSMGFSYRRDGDEMVAETVFGPAFEGPPERVHGGAVAAAVDESMSVVLRLVGQPAYTANLNLSFRAAAPLGIPVEFRARLLRRDGRKLTISCVGSSDEGVFAEAEALFVLVPPPDPLPA